MYVGTAVILLLFANGYRLRFSPFLIAQTGNLLATFTPKNSGVFLDDQFMINNSPARIRGIFPGTHTVRINRDGYLPFERTMRIDPLATAFLNEIFLVRAEPPRAISISTTDTWSAPAAAVVPDKINKLSISINKKTNEVELWSNDNVREPTLHTPGTNYRIRTYDNSETLLVWSQFELTEINPETLSVNLVTRLSSPILNVMSVPETTLVVVQLAEEIRAYQLGIDSPTPITLATAKNILHSAVSTDGTTLAYVTLEKNLYTRWERGLVE